MPHLLVSGRAARFRVLHRPSAPWSGSDISGGLLRAARVFSTRHAVALPARALDATGPRIMIRHILPNALPVVIVQATVIMPVAIIGEATLSFLGLGIRPPAPSLGIMLSDAQQYIYRSPAAAVVPGLMIVIICLAFNLFGDALRDALDAGAR